MKFDQNSVFVIEGARRILINIAAINGWDIFTIDVSQAYNTSTVL